MAESHTQLSFTLLDVPSAHRGRFAALASVLNLASTSCVVWLVAQGALHFRRSPAALITEAFACACLACLSSAAISTLLHAMVPLLDDDHLASEVWQTALTAVWLAPAMVLLAQASPAAPAAVFVAVILATRRIYEQWIEVNTDLGIGCSSPPSISILGHPQAGEPQLSHDLLTSVTAAAAAKRRGGRRRRRSGSASRPRRRGGGCRSGRRCGRWQP